MNKTSESAPEQDVGKEKVTESCRNFNIEEFHDRYFPPYIPTECGKKCQHILYFKNT